jgi:hypothetical protein
VAREGHQQAGHRRVLHPSVGLELGDWSRARSQRPVQAATPIDCLCFGFLPHPSGLVSIRDD